MHRIHLLDQLERYVRTYPEEGACVQRIQRFVEEHPDCFLRSCVPGHITASAWVVSTEYDRFLLVHHRKLDRWLQVGGHVDGEPEVYRAALREAQEESGMWNLSFHVPCDTVDIFDVDVHEIPARGHEPAHLHYDIRFLLVAAPAQRPRPSAESHAVKWFPVRELEDYVHEESVLRMGRKARQLLGEPCV